MEQWVRLYREQGLGSFVRQFWVRERIQPPVQLDTNQVWEWINRSDVAASVAVHLVSDPRFLLVAFSAMARTVGRFWGPPVTSMLTAAELAVYGVDVELFGLELQRLDAEKRRHLGELKGKPEWETDWQTWTLSAACSVANSANLIHGGAPLDVVQVELCKIARCSWEGLRRKLKHVDGCSHESSKYIANTLLVDVLRHYITPQHFSATFTWARQS